MKEKRRSERINYLGTGWLQHFNAKHFCRLENISMDGALISLKQPLREPINQGYYCRLTLYHDAEGHSKEFEACVARCEADQVGLEFVGLDSKLESTLTTIISREQQFYNGAQAVIDLARTLAEGKGITLTKVHFGKGELNPEKEIQILRLSAGKQSVMVDLHRKEIEQFQLQDQTASSQGKIRKTIDRLDGLLKG
jgi:hypothetical protein